MAIGITEKNQIVLDTLQGTQQIEKFVKDEDLKVDDLEGMITRLQKVANKLTQQRDLDKFIIAVTSLEALNLPLSVEVKEKGADLAQLFEDDSRLDKFRPKTPNKRKVKTGTYIVGEHEHKGSAVGALTLQVKEWIDSYNKEHGLDLSYTDIRNPEMHRDDFKFIAD
ncbi:hypothetical protein AB4163_19940 [Vibrio splendidus]